MKYGSVCSGIEAATVAWHPLGWKPAFFSEIEKFPRALLAHHYPDVPLHGDFTTIGTDDYGAIELLVGGTPCQSFSIAGLRGGLADDRGNLALEYLLLAQRKRPRWLVWENVPGVLSTNKGRDFGTFLTALGELGYGFAYRVLDAQYIRVDGFARAVPQRRRRVFVVGYLGDWRRAAAVLFERESLSGHPPPRREQGENVTHDVAPCLTSSGRGVERPGETRGQDPVIAVNLITSTGDVAHCLNAGGMGRQDYETETMVATRDVAARLTRGAESQGKGGYAGRRQEDDDNLVATGVGAVAFMENQQGRVWEADTVQALNKGGGKPGQGYPAIREGWSVRRLTPRECERLQGFPDDYTAIPYRNKSAADGPRYKAIGNSMAVNVMRWIGQRIAAVDAYDNEKTPTEDATP